ncbi:MAG: SBBP repeat-containing protein [Leptospiraceae bacterium]|nr:SBBP repeat-containing protein [Leptospiraceae bacterium]
MKSLKVILILLVITACKPNSKSDDSSNLSLVSLALLGSNTTNSQSDNSSSSSSNNSTTISTITKLIGVTSSQTTGSSVLFNSSGNLFITGHTNGGLDGNTVTGSYDMFITKYDSNYNKLWTKQIGVTSKQTTHIESRIDSSGNLYLTGYTNGNLDGNTLNGAVDLFIAKYDNNGNKLWLKLLGASGKATYGLGISIDSSGNSYITGYTTGGLNGNSLTGNQDVFIAKYNTEGVLQWSKQLGVASKSTYGSGISLDNSGNIYITAYTDGGLDGNSFSGGILDLFICKYNSSGTKQWTKQIGGGSLKMVQGRKIINDSAGNSYISGETTASIDGQTLTGKRDILLLKFDTDGNKQWTKLLGGNSGEVAVGGIILDSSSNIFITGSIYTNGLDGNSLIGSSSDAFLVKFDSTGNKIWTKQLGVSSKQTVSSNLEMNSTTGKVFITGSTYGNLEGNTLNGSYDAFFSNKLNE